MLRKLCLAITILGGPVAGRAWPEDLEVDAVLVKLIQQVEVPAKDPGPLVTVSALEGQLVKKGDLLARQDDELARLAVEQTRLELEIATRQVESDVDLRSAVEATRVAEADVERARQSIVRFPNSISKSELEHLELAATQAKLRVEKLRHDLEVAKVTQRLKETECEVAERKLQRHAIIAPLDGLVVEVLRQEGEWVEPGEQIVRLIRVDRLRVEGFVRNVGNAARLENAPVRVTVHSGSGEEREYRGSITFVSPEIDPVTGQFRVWGEVENADGRLRPGMRGRMAIRLKG